MAGDSFQALLNPGTSGSFQLLAAHLHVHAVEADNYAMVPDGSFAYAPGWTFSETDYTSVFLQSTAARAPAFLFVVPAAGGPLQVSVPCATASPPKDATPYQIPTQIESPNPNPVIDTGNSLEATPCADVSVCGSFTVAMWERDSSGRSAAGSLELQSGQLQHAGTPDTRPLLGSARQLYLNVTDGCFTMAVADHTSILANGFVLHEVPEVAMSKASGTLLGSQVNGDVRLQGTLDLNLGRTANAVSAEVLKGASQAEIDGHPVALASTAVALPKLGRPVIMATLAGMAVIGLAVALLARPPARLAFWFLDVALRNGQRDRDRLALFWAGRAARADPLLADAHILRSYVHALRGDLDQALECRGNAEQALASEGMDEERALNAIEAAWVAHRQGDAPERKRWLALAFQLSPGRAALRLLEPDKADLRPWGIEFAYAAVEGYA